MEAGDSPLPLRRRSTLRRIAPPYARRHAENADPATAGTRGLGIIARKVHNIVPPKVEYSVTAYGRTLRPLLKAMCEWGKAHRENAQAGGANGPKRAPEKNAVR